MTNNNRNGRAIVKEGKIMERKWQRFNELTETKTLSRWNDVEEEAIQVLGLEIVREEGIIDVDRRDDITPKKIKFMSMKLNKQMK